MSDDNNILKNKTFYRKKINAQKGMKKKKTGDKQ